MKQNERHKKATNQLQLTLTDVVLYFQRFYIVFNVHLE